MKLHQSLFGLRLNNPKNFFEVVCFRNYYGILVAVNCEEVVKKPIRIASSYTSNDFESKQFHHVFWLLFSCSRTLSVSDRPTPIREFLSCLGYNNFNWASWTAGVFSAQWKMFDKKLYFRQTISSTFETWYLSLDDISGEYDGGKNYKPIHSILP